MLSFFETLCLAMKVDDDRNEDASGRNGISKDRELLAGGISAPAYRR